MKKLTVLLIGLFFFQAAGRASEAPVTSASVRGEYSALGAVHRTGGAGDRTQLKRGEFLTNELKLRYEQPLLYEWSTTTDIVLRHTNDEQIDKHHDAHVLGWTTEVYNPNWSFTGGDYFGDFSQYSMQQALKGVQAVYHSGEFEAKGLYGFSQRDLEGQQFRRFVAGGRVETLITPRLGFIRDLKVGVNAADVQDDRDSIDNRTGVPEAENRVGSVNASALLWNITNLETELANSWIDEDRSPGNTVDRRAGTALRANSTTRFSKKTKARLHYEWVSADFNTLSGSAVPDRVNLTSRLDHRFNQHVAANLGYRVQHNKLEDSLENKRIVVQAPRAEINWTPASEDWPLKDYLARVYMEQRSRVSQDDESGQTDFVSNDLGFENEFRVQKINFTGGWSIREEDDDRDKSNDQIINTAYLSLRTKTKWFGVDATPSLRYQTEYFDLMKLGGHDVVHMAGAGLRLDISPTVQFEQRYSVSTANRLAQDSDSLRLNAYLGLEYRLPVQQDLTLRVNYEHTGFHHELSTQEFSENNLQAQLLWRF